MAPRFLPPLDRAATMIVLFLAGIALLWLTLGGRPLSWHSLAAPGAATVALWFVWLLGRQFATVSVAAVGVVLASLAVHLAAWASAQHADAAQLWGLCTAAAATWLFYIAIRHQNYSSWIWLGIIAALAIPANHTIFIHLSAYLAFMLRHRSFRDRRNIKGVSLATLSFALAAAPLLWWSAGLDAPPWSTASIGVPNSTQWLSTTGVLSFLAIPFARLLPMATAWLLCAAWEYQSLRPATSAAVKYADEADETRWWQRLTYWDRSFLLWMGLLPGLTNIVLYFVPWASQSTPWPGSYVLLTGFLIFFAMRGDERSILPRLVTLVLALHAALAYFSINGTMQRIFTTYH